ncbi:hypothetical protein [Candidatus Magnetobacterium casense]|uniref:Uncharacterized protein n=1 Tax=Candidatus Magnetobacterium casense TaxID=1455061 RepID=A0ABS6S324_9BACT|nr:hypothetical protein [Candidatus Magnetobacterium casensis]MBV6343246.1 hypothetical protein [Candidatus Magnetobacterium casensis]
MTTHVMNCRNGALTNYDAYDFNSYVDAGNGVVLAAGMDGIYELSGDDDNGQAIDAHIRTGNHDFDSSAIKTIIDAYIGVVGNGEFVLSVITDNNVTTVYSVNSLAIQGHTVKVNLGKGARGRYWTIEFANLNGSDFELDSMEFNVQIMTRRAYASLG